MARVKDYFHDELERRRAIEDGMLDNAEYRAEVEGTDLAEEIAADQAECDRAAGRA